ncbi:MAG: tRNA lysidine(34) synthetase TilS [Actinomycetales bacterium]|nr:tRNA lysidine(34) synthetase TilS [Actinomycetales bacterium]
MATPDHRLLAARKAVSEALAGHTEAVVAVSGGADSLALAACVAPLAARGDLQAKAVIVDHQLQPESEQVAARAAEQVRALGLPALVVRVEVGSEGGPAAAARTARLAALEDVAGPGTPILLAHTQDDQAETVLLGLGRGSGARSLWGMRPVDGRWLRPFLGLTRADTEHVCTVEGLDWWSDPHNQDSRFRRVRIRNEVLPLLEEVLGGGASGALARTAEHLFRDREALDAIAATSLTYDATQLELQPRAIRTRVLRLLALDAGAIPGELSAKHLSEMERLVTHWHGQLRVELPGHVSVKRVGNVLAFMRT